jgi:D-inositol-3-phosphate glycosyltransferase
MTHFPRRVALVSEHADPLADVGHPETGGQNVYVAALATELGRLGCAVDVYTRQAEPRSRRCVTMAPGVTVHRVPCGPPGPIARDELMPVMPAFAAGLAAAWRRRPPDVVHAHFWMSGWAASAAAPPRTPVVLTFHALGTVKRRHQGAADTSPPERIAVERRLLQTVDTVVATCRDEVAELDRLGRGRGRTVVVPCGVSATFSPFGPVDATPRRHSHRLVTVSRIVPRKGIGDVVQALPEVPDTELVVVGGSDPGTPDPDAAGLRDLAARLGVGDRLELRGRLDAGGVAAVMRSADAVVCAPWYEPFGIVPVEAMACGVPVVGTAVGGLLDTVHDGRTGLLVPPRRPDTLASALTGLLGDPARRRRMGVAGAEQAQCYSWPRVAAALMDVYGDVLTRRGHTDAREALA